MALPQFDDCYRYEVTPTTSIERLSVRQAATGEVNTSYVFGDGNDATLADNVTVGMCVEVGNLTPAQAARLDVFRFEPVEGTVNTLRDASAAFLPCESALGTTGSVGVSRALRRGWHLVVNQLHYLLGTRTAYASTSVIHLGLGGSTCCTSYFTWGIPGVMSPNGPTTFSASPGSTVVPSVVVKDSGGTPIAGAMVTFAVATGNGTIAGTNPMTTGADGVAQVSWQLPSTAGPYSLTASAPGAAGSPITFTATVTGGVAGKPLYVANEAGNNILVFAAGASGSATPTATIAGGNTGLDFPYGVAHDGAGNIYATNSGSSGVGSSSITVYAAGANGDAAPIATIRGSNTGLNFPLGIALDGAGDIYVANFGASNILIFAAGASGNVTPIATIAVASPCTTYGVALDGAGNLYVTNFGCNNVLIFAAGSGNATLIAGGNTGLTDPAGIALDGAGKIHVASPGHLSHTG